MWHSPHFLWCKQKMMHCRCDYSNWLIIEASFGRRLRLHSVDIYLCRVLLLRSCLVYVHAHGDTVISKQQACAAEWHRFCYARHMQCRHAGTRARGHCYHVKQTFFDFAIPTWRGVGPSRKKRSNTPLSATQLVLVLSPSWLTSTNISAAFSLHSMTVIASLGFASCLTHGLHGQQLHSGSCCEV